MPEMYMLNALTSDEEQDTREMKVLATHPYEPEEDR